MDPTTFDRLTRVISGAASRRGALAALLGAVGAPLLATPEAAARRRKAKGRQRGRGPGRGKDQAKHETADCTAKYPDVAGHSACAAGPAAATTRPRKGSAWLRASSNAAVRAVDPGANRVHKRGR
jgi:hypothetical protein